MANNQSLGSDSKKVMVEFLVPPLVKYLVDQIPDVTYEQFVVDYQKIWDAALPFLSFAVLRTFNAPDIMDEITTEIMASVKVAMDDRTSDLKDKNGTTKKAGPQNSSKSALVKDLLCLLTEEESSRLIKLIDGLEESQKVRLLDAHIDLIQKDSLTALKNVSRFDANTFKLWAAAVAPMPKPKPEIAKKISIAFKTLVENPSVKKIFDDIADSTSSLKSDLEGRMGKGTFVSRFAQRIRDNRKRKEEKRKRKDAEKKDKETKRDEIKQAKRDVAHQIKLNKIKSKGGI